MQGMGYQEYKKFLSKTVKNSKKVIQENKEHERFVIYFGRAHLDDIDTGASARGLLKIGRGKWLTAIMRGRNQPGIDFRVYAEIILDSNEATYEAERVIKEAISHKRVNGTQNQQELYNISDADLYNTVVELAQIIDAEVNCNILEINTYLD